MNAILTSKPSTTTDTLTDARVSAAPESDLTPLLTAWDQAHPAVTVAGVDMGVDADWRHILDEIAHPHTIEAFHRLAAAAAPGDQS